MKSLPAGLKQVTKLVLPHRQLCKPTDEKDFFILKRILGGGRGGQEGGGAGSMC